MKTLIRAVGWLVVLVLAISTVSCFASGLKVGGAVSGSLAGLLFLLLRRRRHDWRADPATEKQRAFADELGIRYPRKISKGELSDMISAKTGR